MPWAPKICHCPNAEALHYCPAFLCAELRIGVHGRHQNRRVLIIGRLFARHAVGIHVYIASERYMVGEIDQHRLALQMTAGTLIYLEAQISEAKNRMESRRKRSMSRDMIMMMGS